MQTATWMISDASELRKEWFEGARRVGITGATSTPRWLMEQCADAVAAL
ncbi:MAG: hypothetical protein SPJ13_06105 [Bacteroidales bacterium]|nr:hypothetical protein [Bacteroidales bacterium]